MFKPHVTVACVVQAEGQFLVAEETIQGQPRWNQPAGHLEANETLIEAAQRELWGGKGNRCSRPTASATADTSMDCAR